MGWKEIPESEFHTRVGTLREKHGLNDNYRSMIFFTKSIHGSAYPLKDDEHPVVCFDDFATNDTKQFDLMTMEPV